MCQKTKKGFAEGIGNLGFWLSHIKEQQRNIEECEMNKKMKNELIEKIVAVVIMSDNGEEDRTDNEVCMYV
ncbi:MAG: hypothetical protein OR994_06055 [Candidatus Poseidoniales archaeon]|nr:hypothetical protein [Candidatus Poseidoniales archaeon]